MHTSPLQNLVVCNMNGPLNPNDIPQMLATAGIPPGEGISLRAAQQTEDSSSAYFALCSELIAASTPDRSRNQPK